nr:hypothetical protein [Candidatus Sigynarchaeum springense]
MIFNHGVFAEPLEFQIIAVTRFAPFSGNEFLSYQVAFLLKQEAQGNSTVFIQCKQS